MADFHPKIAPFSYNITCAPYLITAVASNAGFSALLLHIVPCCVYRHGSQFSGITIIIFHIKTGSVRPSVRPSVWRCISETAWRILLISEVTIGYYSGMMPEVSKFGKKPRWPTYGRFSSENCTFFLQYHLWPLPDHCSSLKHWLFSVAAACRSMLCL